MDVLGRGWCWGGGVVASYTYFWVNFIVFIFRKMNSVWGMKIFFFFLGGGGGGGAVRRRVTTHVEWVCFWDFHCEPI